MTTDPEHYISQKDMKWMTDDDILFLDGLDKELGKYVDIDNKLDKVVEETPKSDNPIRRLDFIQRHYDDLSDEGKQIYIVSLKRAIHSENTSEFDRNIAKTFLHSLGEGWDVKND